MNIFKILIMGLITNIYTLGYVNAALGTIEVQDRRIVTQIPEEIKISVKKSEVEIGEPLIFEMVYSYNEPAINPKTGEIIKAAEHSAKLVINKIEENTLKPVCNAPLALFCDKTLYLKKNDKKVYENSFVIFNFSKSLVINEPGIYTIQVKGWTRQSNVVSINIIQSPELKKALSLISDPNDISFLAHGDYDNERQRDESILHLKKVVEEHKGTTLAKWCAARLGLEYFGQIYKNDPGFRKLKERKEKEGKWDPLFEETYAHLDIASQLPDDFPIKEDVLGDLAIIESLKGNNEKASFLVNELANKYPNGQFVKRALGRELMNKYKLNEQSPTTPKDPNGNKR